MSRRHVKELRSWHRVKYRSAKTKKLRAFTPRVKLIAEVYSKKTGKRIGYLNLVKNGKPIPRKYTSKQRAVYHRRIKTVKTRKEIPHENLFTIYYNKFVSDQIPDWVWRDFNNHITLAGYVQFSLHITGADNKNLGFDEKSIPERYLNKKTRSQWVDRIATIIIALLRRHKIRTSPKAWSKTRKYWKSGKTAEWHYMKKYKVRPIVYV